jgi:hypothetical protein
VRALLQLARHSAVHCAPLLHNKLLALSPRGPLHQVRETRVVCKGWADRLAWMEAGDSKADDDETMRHVLMSAHGRLEGINAPFIQVCSCNIEIFPFKGHHLSIRQGRHVSAAALHGVMSSQHISTPPAQECPTVY